MCKLIRDIRYSDAAERCLLAGWRHCEYDNTDGYAAILQAFIHC